MSLHSSTFEYLKPTEAQLEQMNSVRMAFLQFAQDIGPNIPEGPDKTFMMRQLRDCAMWANIAITRNPDGSPRS